MLLALRAANKSRSSLRRNNSSIEMIGIDIDCERQTDKIVTKEAKVSVTTRQDQLDDNHCNIVSLQGKVRNINNTENGCVKHICCTNIFQCFLFHKIHKNKCKTVTSVKDQTIDKLDNESRRTSWLIFVVSTIVLLHEIPLTTANIYTLVKHSNEPLPLSIIGCFSVIQQLWQFITYPAIFLISTCMSSSFRQELWKTISLNCKQRERHSRSSNKRVSLLSPCSVRKLTTSNRNEIADGLSNNGIQDDNDMIDVSKNNKRKDE
jgi:hypothetical protein